MKTAKALALAALVSTTLGLLLLALNVTVRESSSALDFANFYTAGRILRQFPGRNLCDLALQMKVEREFMPKGLVLPYDHPPFEAWLFAPLAYFSYPHAFVLWGVINLALLALIVWLLRFTGCRLDTEGQLVWLLLCIPLVAGVLILGQDSLLLAVVFLLAYLALKRHWDHAAGLALGLGCFRFEIVLPLVFIFFVRRRWKVVAGFLAASILALLASVALVGWRGILDYVNLLQELGRLKGSLAYQDPVAAMPSLRGGLVTLLGGVIPHVLLLPLVLVATLALLGWAAWHFKNIARPEDPAFDLEFSLVSLGALLSSYYLFAHELTPLIVIGFLLLAYERTRPHEGILGNRRGTALLLLFAVVYGIGGTVFHFRDFSVLFIVLLGLMVWLSQELSILRGPEQDL